MSDEDIYQKLADATGKSRAWAKEQMLRALYSGNFPPPPVPNINVGDRVRVTMKDGEVTEFKVKSSNFTEAPEGFVHFDYPQFTDSMTGRFTHRRPDFQDVDPPGHFTEDMLKRFQKRAREEVDLKKLGIFTGPLPSGCVDAIVVDDPEGQVYWITNVGMG